MVWIVMDFKIYTNWCPSSQHFKFHSFICLCVNGHNTWKNAGYLSKSMKENLKLHDHYIAVDVCHKHSFNFLSHEWIVINDSLTWEQMVFFLTGKNPFDIRMRRRKANGINYSCFFEQFLVFSCLVNCITPLIIYICGWP